MKDVLTIESVMHRQPYTINVISNLATAISTLKEHGIRHLPVKEANGLVGIITERDINFALRVELKDPEEMLVRDAFTSDPYVVEPKTSVAEVAARTAHDHIGCALIVDGQKLLGIFTAVDACRVLSETLKGNPEQ